jgi:hypothetical protein
VPDSDKAGLRTLFLKAGVELKLPAESLHIFTERGDSHVVTVFQTGHGGLLEAKGFGCGFLKGHFLDKNFRRTRLNGRTALLGQGSHKFPMCCHRFFSLPS